MRFVICLLLGLATGAVAYKAALLLGHPGDFAQIHYAARAMLAGHDPYALIGPGRALEWANSYFYPMPATLLAVPLAPLPAPWAGAVFVGIGGACLAWALSRESYEPLVAFGGASIWFAAQTAQWSPLLAAATALPVVGVAFAAKPTIAAAIFAARPSWWPVVGGVVLLVLSFAIDPAWLGGWLAAVRETRLGPGGGVPYLAPVTLPGGALVLVALTRWRRWEARLLVALACVPQTTLLYETVPLFLIPRTWREAAALAALSWAAFGYTVLRAPYAGLPELVTTSGRVIVLALYLPALVMVLRRPNEGPAPAWIERATSRAPGWLRGRSAREAAA